MKFNLNLGGRPPHTVGQAGALNDCVIRSLAIATQSDCYGIYKDVVKFAPFCESEGVNVLGAPFLEYAESLGFVFVPKPYKPVSIVGLFGKFKESTFLVLIQNHLTAVVAGELNDLFDCTRAEVKGYFIRKSETGLYNLYTSENERINMNPMRIAEALKMYGSHARNYRVNSVILPA